MSQHDRDKITTTLTATNELIVRAAQALGQHPDNRELQKRFAKLVGQRDQLEQAAKLKDPA